MSAKAKKENDKSKFEGDGISFRAKLIGIDDVSEARGDQMCQDALVKLKNDVKNSGEHKQKIIVNVSLEGLKIVDAISMVLLHSHAVHRISFISRDVTDNRAFGYVYGEGDGTHKFFAIKTAAAAEHLVFTIRDLFQVVYDLKKQEMEEAKEKLEKGEVAAPVEENSQTSRNGSTSGDGQTPQTTATADSEGIYQVPPNNAPVKVESQAEQAANLLDLEDQAETILKGIEQIKNLEFDSLPEDTLASPVSPPTSPFAKLAPPSNPNAGNADPWGLAAAPPASTPASSGGSALGDLAGLQTSSVPVIPGFPGSPFATPGTTFPQQPFPMQQPGFGAPQIGQMSGGLPVTKDPFANDPFSANANAQFRPQGQVGFPAAQNPFGGNAFGQQPFGAPQPGVQPMGMVPGGVPTHYPVQMAGGVRNPFAAQQQPPAQMTNAFGESEPSLLQPTRQDGSQADTQVPKAKEAKPGRDDLFGDLLEIKKSTSASAKSPKDMFKQINASEKKSLNEIKKEVPASEASTLNFDAFGTTPVNGNVTDKPLL